MSQLTKQQLTVENNSSFPNNNTGFITPELLRTFNQDMIDSTVNQTVYTTDSASFDSRISAGTVPAGTISSSAQVVAALPSNVVSSSTDTSTIDMQILNGSIRGTVRGGVVSGSAQITALGFVSSSVTGSSLITASFDNNSRNLTFTKGDLSTFNVNIPDASGSAGIDTGSFATTGSNVFLGNQQITGSLSVSSSTAPTAYFKGGNAGNNTGVQFDSRVDVHGQLVANTDFYANGAFINQISYNGAQPIRIGSDLRLFDVNNPPGSEIPINLIVSGAAMISGSLTASLQTGYTYVGNGAGRTTAVPTSSFSGGSTGSLMVTGSVNVNVLTFTKGDGSTFDLTVAASGSAPAGTISSSQQVIDALPTGTVSGSDQLTGSYDGRYTLTSSFQSYTSSNDDKVNQLINKTGSYATTGSNSFVGAQTISGSVLVSGSFTANTFVVGTSGTSGSFPVLFQSASTITKDSVDTIIYNPNTNTLLVSASSGFTQINNGAFSAHTASGNLARVSALSTILVQSNIEGGLIGFSGNPSKIGAPSLASSTNPGFLAQSGSTPTFYVPLEFQPSASFTDGRVTANRLFRAASSIEVSGSLNVSGSQSIQKGNFNLSGSFFIQSSSAFLPESTGSGLLTYDQSNGQVKFSKFTNLISASLSCGEFWSTTTQSGSAGVSGSLTFNNSGSVFGVTLSDNTKLTIVNPGTYNIQFSAQIESSAGADTQYIWFKKNGTNIDDSATKVLLANNTAQVMTVNILDTAVANDYYELAFENKNGNATILYEPASGSVPAIPSVIATVTQVK